MERKLDAERREKVFRIAKKLKANTYTLSMAWDDEEDKWLLVCTAKINDQVYDSANHLDEFTAQEHADLFRYAFSEALKQSEVGYATHPSLILH